MSHDPTNPFQDRSETSRTIKAMTSPTGSEIKMELRNANDMVREIGRVGAWAPGAYWCKCVSCEKPFEGDKRALRCLPCTVAALLAQNRRLIEALEEITSYQKGFVAEQLHAIRDIARAAIEGAKL